MECQDCLDQKAMLVLTVNFKIFFLQYFYNYLDFFIHMISSFDYHKHFYSLKGLQGEKGERGEDVIGRPGSPGPQGLQVSI